MGWFPQQYADTFNVIKGLLGMVGVILLILHMNEIWPYKTSFAQKLRFMLLLGYSGLTVYSSAHLVADHAEVQFVNVLAFLMTIALIVVVVISIREWRKDNLQV